MPTLDVGDGVQAADVVVEDCVVVELVTDVVVEDCVVVVVVELVDVAVVEDCVVELTELEVVAAETVVDEALDVVESVEVVLLPVPVIRTPMTEPSLKLIDVISLFSVHCWMPSLSDSNSQASHKGSSAHC